MYKVTIIYFRIILYYRVVFSISILYITVGIHTLQCNRKFKMTKQIQIILFFLQTFRITPSALEKKSQQKCNLLFWMHPYVNVGPRLRKKEVNEGWSRFIADFSRILLAQFLRAGFFYCWESRKKVHSSLIFWNSKMRTYVGFPNFFKQALLFFELKHIFKKLIKGFKN